MGSASPRMRLSRLRAVLLFCLYSAVGLVFLVIFGVFSYVIGLMLARVFGGAGATILTALLVLAVAAILAFGRKHLPLFDAFLMRACREWPWSAFSLLPHLNNLGGREKTLEAGTPPGTGSAEPSAASRDHGTIQERKGERKQE